jgi:NAD(P)-dependent dehydrogenase (short-subunit alcohol dehydrogenase family)
MMQDKVILVTGATGALGRVVARTMAATGARVALTARRQEALDALVDELDAEGSGRVWAQAADLAVAQDVERLVSALAERWGGVDILLNTAGGWRGGVRVADVSEEEWDFMLDMNLRSAFLINRAVLPYMVKQGWGRIVNVGSSSAVAPRARGAQYAVSKAGVVALTAAIAADYRRSGVAANVILPSIIDTPANRRGMPDADTSRWVKPQEIAELMLFLCSEAGGSLNGASVPVYGRV